MKIADNIFSCPWLLIHQLFNKSTIPLGKNSCKRTYFKLMSHWTIFSDDLPRYDVATKRSVTWHAIANVSWREATRCVFLIWVQKLATVLPELLSSASLRNSMSHWNDFQRNIVSLKIVQCDISFVDGKPTMEKLILPDFQKFSWFFKPYMCSDPGSNSDPTRN